MSYIEALLNDIQQLPNDFRIRGSVGSGPFARLLGDDLTMQKIILPGDDRATILQQLGYLFWDLLVDCGWSDEDREGLRDEILAGE